MPAMRRGPKEECWTKTGVDKKSGHLSPTSCQSPGRLGGGSEGTTATTARPLQPIFLPALHLATQRPRVKASCPPSPTPPTTLPPSSRSPPGPATPSSPTPDPVATPSPDPGPNAGRRPAPRIGSAPPALGPLLGRVNLAPSRRPACPPPVSGPSQRHSGRREHLCPVPQGPSSHPPQFKNLPHLQYTCGAGMSFLSSLSHTHLPTHNSLSYLHTHKCLFEPPLPRCPHPKARLFTLVTPRRRSS